MSKGSKAPAEGDDRLLRITTKREGFWRAGIPHFGTVDHAPDKFTADQVEALLAEPNLVVEFVARASE